MENKHKQFKPFEKVLVRSLINPIWSCDFYSHYKANADAHDTVCFRTIKDSDILPYEGNESLLGTTDEPEEEVQLEEGELLVYFEKIKYLEEFDLFLARFDGTTDTLIRVKTECVKKWEFAIRFSDFNPDDMEETMKHILCVKNGKVVRYKK